MKYGEAVAMVKPVMQVDLLSAERFLLICGTSLLFAKKNSVPASNGMYERRGNVPNMRLAS